MPGLIGSAVAHEVWLSAARFNVRISELESALQES